MKIYCVYYHYDYEGDMLTAIGDSFNRVIDLYNKSTDASYSAESIIIEERILNSNMINKIWRYWRKSYSVQPIPKDEGWELIFENKDTNVMENFT